MQLEIRTLLIAVSLSMAVCAGARLILWRLHPTIPGLSSWAAAGLCGAGSLSPLGLWEVVPPPVALAVAQMLGQAGLLFALDGFRRFHGRGGFARWTLVLCVFCLLVPFLGCLEVGRSSLVWAANPAILAILSLLIVRHLFQASGYLTVRVTGLIYLVNAGFFFARASAVAQEVPPLGDLMRGEARILLWWLGATLGITLGMILMTSERLKHDLEDQASRDPLTGALNRRAFAMMAEKELARSFRSGRPLSILMMDLDHFKAVNDRRGHAVGDATLCHFVQVAVAILRGEDVFCRFGGEEFLALLPGSGACQAMTAAERLRIAFAHESRVRETERAVSAPPFFVTVSIGVHELFPGEDLEAAIRQADAALYRAKEAGRNCCELAGEGVLVEDPASV